MVWIGEERQAGEESALEDAIKQGATMAAPWRLWMVNSEE
jgi:hypothetical protein